MSSKVRVTVCQLSDDVKALEEDWQGLIEHVSTHKSRLVLLPEMPFYPWLHRSRIFEQHAWRSAIEAHERWLLRIPELGQVALLGSRPVDRDGRRLNQAFLWTPELGLQDSHAKYYLPDDEGFWEASWYERGDPSFTHVQAGDISIGFLICTELWFMDRARRYGRSGVQVLATPRATLLETADKWLVGGRAAAVISGAYSLSSNRASPSGSELVFGGQGWIVGPDGDVLALTSTAQPFATVEIDLTVADQAKTTYPRYVVED